VAKKEKKGLPPWMATFADLSTLLLTFFVLLLTFANMDVQKFKEMLGSVKDAFGVQFEEQGQFQPVKPKPQPVPQRESLMQTRPVAPIASARDEVEARQMAAKIRQLVKEVGLDKAVQITAGRGGVRLRVKGRLLFEPGQAVVKRGAMKLLHGLAQVMKKFRYYLTVEGHTDSLPIRNARFPSNWELSAARATAVLRALVSMGVPKRRVVAVGYADNYPIADNSTEAGREKNRRVEFVLTKRPLRMGVE